MHENNKNLAVLSVAEQAAYYELPDFNDEQRYEFLTLTPSELELAMSRSSLAVQVYCCLQIGDVSLKPRNVQVALIASLYRLELLITKFM